MGIPLHHQHAGLGTGQSAVRGGGLWHRRASAAFEPQRRPDHRQRVVAERARVHKENAVRLGDVIYASTGHLGPPFFTAIDVKTGKVLWQDRSFSHANFLYADGKFIILDEDGALGLATPTAHGLTVHSRIEILTSRSWTVPRLVSRTLYLRDRKNIMALQL